MTTLHDRIAEQVWGVLVAAESAPQNDIVIVHAIAKNVLAVLDPPVYRDEQGRELFCPRCGGPDAEGYPREALDQ